MMHLFINASGASAGGGLTYLANLLPYLSSADVRTTVAVNSDFHQARCAYPRVEYLQFTNGGNVAHRFWREQSELPRLIRDCGANILLSAGNFALRNSPVPQVLLSRNSLYTCSDFSRDLLRRGEYRMWFENRIKGTLARRSVAWADRTVAPSAAFARDLEKWTGRPIVALHHGFDREFFNASNASLPKHIEQKLDITPGTVRVLMVSHYNYYRNFETAFSAIAKLKEQLGASQVRLFLTCELEKSKTPGAYNPEPARRLIEQLGIREQVVELGAVAYEQLHHVYRACDIYVTAAYTETFAHPLVEAMSCDLPIIASDLPVHREICGDAALYFPRFGAEDLAVQLLQLTQSQARRQNLVLAGRERYRSFSWQSHVQQLLRLAEELLGSAASPAKSRSMSAA